MTDTDAAEAVRDCLGSAVCHSLAGFELTDPDPLMYDKDAGSSEGNGGAGDRGGGGPEVKLPRVARALNLVLFGDGQYWVLPLLLGGGSVVGGLSSIALQASVLKLVLNVAAAVEAATNAYFGYSYCRAGRISRLVRTAAEPHSSAEHDATRALGRFAWGTAAVTGTLMAGWQYANYTPEQISPWPVWSSLAVGYTLLSTIYLSALWLWCNWLFWRAGRGVVARGISASSVAQRRAGRAVFGLLDEMRLASRVWAINHAVRAVTMITVAEALVQSGEAQASVRVAAYSGAAVLFLVVLATAAAPGFVTTDFYENLQRRLAAVAHDGDEGGLGGDEELGKPPPRDTPTALMQRIAAAGSGAGMHFAGIPMTVEKSVKVAVLVLYLTKYFAMPASCHR
jgi:hypothetical protein